VEASALFGDADNISTDDEAAVKSESDKASHRKGSGSERSRGSESRSVSLLSSKDFPKRNHQENLLTHHVAEILKNY
jgi:hypothetical protein